MKLHLSNAGDKNIITGYKPKTIEINKESYQKNLILLDKEIRFDFEHKTIQELTEQDFELIKGLNPELVLVGTGEKQQFLHPKLTRCLFENKIGIEFMTTQALCRTYNILVAEDRNVIAVVFL